MSKDSAPLPWPEYLRDAIASAGYTTPTAFARAAGIAPSAVSRWLSGSEPPRADSLRKISPVLGRSVDELWRASSGEYRPSVAAAVHPLARELDRMLSALPEADRERVATLVDALLEPYRRRVSGGRAA